MKYLCFIWILLLFSCKNEKHKVIVIQPFSDFPTANANAVYQKVKQINPNTILAPAIALPKSAFYVKRNRYRADSLLKFLNKPNSDTIVVGITSKDISTGKDQYADWGVMGLGYTPGNACVVSLFRLSKANTMAQFYKVVIHELGHTAGLPHCSNPACFMRDAEGGNPLDKEKDFCTACKAYLKNKGWLLQ